MSCFTVANKHLLAGNDDNKPFMGQLDISKGISLLFIFNFLLHADSGSSSDIYFLHSLVILLDLALDQAMVDSSIPLSPQWLYVKPSDTKMVSLLTFQTS